MLLTPAKSVPTGDRWIHESKVDGCRWCAEVDGERVRVRSRDGHEWSSKLPELGRLSRLGDGLVLNGELTLVTPDGRADFELLCARLAQHVSRWREVEPVTLYVFDVLRR